MKTLGSGFIIAFSMYSKVPMPRVEWTVENRRYVMSFFPLVGLLISAAEWVWFLLTLRLGIGVFLRSAVAVLLPLLISGGIHLDGFLDVCDAMSSWREREERKRILKDPHVGAFSVIGAAIYFSLALGLATEVTAVSAPILFLGFPLARSFSAISVLLMPSASPSGTAAGFAAEDRKLPNLLINCAYIAVILVCMFRFSAAVSLVVLAGLLFAYVYFVYLVRKVFGGISGDLAGHFVCLAEILMLAGAVLTEIIGRAAGWY